MTRGGSVLSSQTTSARGFLMPKPTFFPPCTGCKGVAEVQGTGTGRYAQAGQVFQSHGCSGEIPKLRSWPIWVQNVFSQRNLARAQQCRGLKRSA